MLGGYEHVGDVTHLVIHNLVIPITRSKRSFIHADISRMYFFNILRNLEWLTWTYDFKEPKET